MSLTTNPQVPIGAFIPGSGGGGGSGTVTSVSVVSANGLAGTVATATTTPAITLRTSITGVLKGNGTAISAAAAGTDYQAPITLTTTGTSGAATFAANTLNIPQYAGADSNLNLGQVEAVIANGGSVITTGVAFGADVPIPYAGTITQVTMLSMDSTSGSIVVDIWKNTYTNYPPVVANTITGSALPTITTAIKSQSSTLTGWTTSVSAGDILRFNVNSVTSLKLVKLILSITKT